MEINIRHVHVGAEIEKRRVELGLSKSELGRRIGVPQQHVNRILERETMETSRLVKVSEALDCNFFSFFCSIPQQISAYLAAVSLHGSGISKGSHQAFEGTDSKSEYANNTP